MTHRDILSSNRNLIRAATCLLFHVGQRDQLQHERTFVFLPFTACYRYPLLRTWFALLTHHSGSKLRLFFLSGPESASFVGTRVQMSCDTAKNKKKHVFSSKRTKRLLFVNATPNSLFLSRLALRIRRVLFFFFFFITARYQNKHTVFRMRGSSF